MRFTDADVPDQSGRTFFVTGANTGIGFEAARVLARRGARVLMGCRNPAKAEAARDQILAETPSADLGLVSLDLADLDSVRAAAEVVGAEPRLDVLVNNAGVMMPPKTLTAQGFELQIGVNHLGPFALTGLLWPKLNEQAGARIVNTSSNGHRMGMVDFDDVAAEKSYRSLERYGASKLANLLHAYELQRRLQAKGSGIVVTAAHPGGPDTELFRHIPGAFRSVARIVSLPFLNQPRAGCWPTLAAATLPDVAAGTYFGPWFFQLRGAAKVVQSNATSHDRALQQKLWEWSIELTGVDPGL